MSAAPDEPIQAILAPPAKRLCCAWLAWVAWLAILGLCGFQFLMQMQRAEDADKNDPADKNALNSRVQQTALRSIVGLKTFAPNQDMAKIAELMDELNAGPKIDRVRAIAALGDMAGPEEGAKRLLELRKLIQDDADKKGLLVPLSGAEIVTLRGLEHVFADRAAKKYSLPSVSKLEREQLGERLGWFGKLALLPPESTGEALAKRAELLEEAVQTGLFLVGFGGYGAGLLLLGVVALGFFLFKLSAGTLTLRFATGAAHGGVYAETFALWLGALLGLRWLAQTYLDDVPPLLLASGAALASLFVLVWPVLRGVPAHQVRADLGWSSDTNPLMDLWAGFLAYAASLPVVAAVAVVSVLLLFPLLNPAPADGPADPFASPVYPSHPIVHTFAGADWRDFLTVLLLTAVVAPIVEETMFRGVLYRNLREATRGWGRLASWLFTMLLSSLLFAAIHPQGFAAVPLLMSLACGFCFMREWRGALLPSIFAHSFSNATITSLAFFLLR